MLSLEDNKVAKLGEESLVRLAVERDDINLNDLETYMKAMGEPTCGECAKGGKCKVHKYGLKCVKFPASVLLPPMRYAIEGPSWDLVVGRHQLTEYMVLEGYGSSLSYKEDIPGWWPESIDHKKWFEKFKHPGGANIKHLALFLRAILQHYGHDAETYHQEGIIEKIEPKRKKPQKKWKSKKSKQVMPDDTIEEDIAEEEANRDRAARAMEAARAELRDMEENRNMSEERHEVVEDTDRVESRSEEEVANRARAAKAMEAARAGGRDTAEASDMEDVLDTAEDHDTAEITDRVEERYELVEVILGKDKPCYICRGTFAEDLFYCSSCYNPYHQLCLQMQHLPQHKGLNGSGSMCGRCLNSKDSYEEDMNNRAKSIEAKCEEINGKQYQVISFLSDPDQDKLDQDLNLDTVDPWEMPQLPSFGLQSLNDLPGSYDVDFDRYLQTNGLAISLGE